MRRTSHRRHRLEPIWTKSSSYWQRCSSFSRETQLREATAGTGPSDAALVLGDEAPGDRFPVVSQHDTGALGPTLQVHLGLRE